MQVFFDKCSKVLDYTIKNKSFGIFHSTENKQNCDIHTHECCEIFLCLKGGNHFLINEKIYDVNNGDLFFINPFEAHKIIFSPNQPVERYVLQIHPEFMFHFSTEQTNLAKCFYNKSNDKHNKISLDCENLGLLKGYFKSLEHEYEFADDVIKQSIVLQLLSRLNLLAHCINSKEEIIIQNSPLQTAIAYIDAHFKENINLDIIAKNSYISVTQLCKLFKDNLGTTTVKYITRKRIAEAKKYLRQGYSVSEVAMLCGFGDYSNFIRTFSSQVGISPGKYIKRGTAF